VLSPGESGALNVNVNFGPYTVTPIGLENEIIAFSNDPTGVQFTDTSTNLLLINHLLIQMVLMMWYMILLYKIRVM